MTLEHSKLLRALVAIGMISGLSALAVPPPTGIAPVLIPVGGFRIDGDLMADAITGDWVGGTNAAAGVLNTNGIPLNPATTFHFVDPFNTTSDNTFVGGLKWTDDPNVWQWTTSKASSKTDINNVLLHVARDADGHTWSVIAADRFSTSGDSYIDFEFLQNPLVLTNGGKFASSGLNGGRTVNDLLLSLAFTSGGSVADFLAYRWLPNGSGGYGYVDVTAQLPVGRVFVALNSNNVAVPFGAFGVTTYVPNAFAEAALDMTALLGGFDPCLSVGFKTIMVKTKSSQSSTASISDFINPIQYSLRIGPSAEAGGNQARCNEGTSTAFVLQGKASAGMAAIASTTWSVVNGSAIIDAPNSLVTTVHVSSASATLRLSVAQANGCTETNDAVLTVVNPPASTIAGSSTTCPNSTNVFQGPAGMDDYAWSISGNGTISGVSNAATVKVIAGGGCGATFTLSLAVTKGICSSSGSTDVLVVDTTPPTITAPADRTLDCPADTSTNATGVAAAQDDCGKVNVSYSDAVTSTCGGTRVITRTWTAFDQCGNLANAIQTITVRDITPPTLVLPANRTLDCPANTDPSNTGTATATDSCSAVTVSFSDSVSNNCGGASIIKRLWTATDLCGNSISGVQTITVRDITAPSLIIPANMTLECPADTSTNNTGIATAIDGCSATTITYSDVVSNSCGGSEVIQRTWTARDQCGNVTNRVQVITVRDTTRPSLILPPNITLDCPTTPGTNNTGVAVAQDTCGSVSVSFNDVVTTNCGGTKVVARTWTAIDSCGNSTNGIQNITVRDSIPPALVIPPNVTLECPANTSTNNTGIATAIDGCSTATVTYNDVTVTNCGGTKVIQRTWTARDLCGNTTNAIQTITVRDSTPPTLTLPANLTLECPANTNVLNTGVATAQDGCGNVTVTFSDVVSNSCGGAKLISRIWRATDSCGNTATGTQLITVRDTTAPTIVAPPNLTLECPTAATTNITGVASVTDGCSATTVSFVDSVSNNCGGTKIIYRTWRATDGCGNLATALQTITVVDTTPPTLTLPADVVQQCPGDTRTNVTGIARSTDGCGAVTIIYSDIVSNGCGLTRTVWRQWTATDQCGHSTNGMQTISVIDTTKPRINCPTISVQCAGDVPPAYTNLSAFLAAGGTVADSCSSSLSFAFVSDSGLVGSCPGTVTRVYRVTDACGNYSDGTQRITVKDTIPPVLTVPTNMIVECGSSFDPVSTGRATATDNCDTNVNITYTDTALQSQYDLKFYVADPDTGTGPYGPTYLEFAPGSLPCPESARLTGRALDPLRNAVAYSTNGQLDALTSIGNVPMAFGQIVPFEVVIQASGGPGPERGTIEFTADWGTYTTSNNRFGYDTNYMVYCAFVDAADPGLIDPNYNARVESYSATVVNRGTIAEAIRGTFRVSGIESGDRIVVEIWVVLDSTMPDHTGGTVAATLVSAQTAAVPPAPISIGTQTDSLGNLSKIGNLPPPQTQSSLGPLPVQPPTLPGATVSVFDRTWTATDDCGNQSTGVQRITVRDTVPPSLIAPPDVVLECPATDTSTNATGTTVAFDSCGSVTLTYSDRITNGYAGTQMVQMILRTWTATDQAGLSTNAIQTITIKDSTPPSIIAPGDVVLECPASNTSTNVTGTAVALDTCGPVTLTYSDLFTNGFAGTQVTEVILRTWSATNKAGLSTNVIQTITVKDTTPPTLTIIPAMRLVDVGGSWGFGQPIASDTCGAVTVSTLNTLTNLTATNTMVVSRTWLATDAVGNTNTCCQSLVINLGPPPTIVKQPLSQTFAYGDNGALSVTATCINPLTYQWRFGGINIAGATNSTLQFTGIQFSNVGPYTVVISSAGGSITSSVAVVSVLPRLTGVRTGGTLILTWPAPFILQSAPSVNGPYRDVPGAVSPYSVPMTAPQQFFRLRAGPPSLNLKVAGGVSTVTLTGTQGDSYILQASSDMVHWTNLHTNALPMVYVDSAASQFPRRFYRAMLAH